MNSIRRGAPVPVAPVFRMPVILPKLADGLLAAKEPRLLEGFLYIGWLNRLKADAVKLSRNLSDSLKILVSELSISKLLGPRAAKRGRFPQVPLAGSANAAGLSQLLMVWFAG